MSRRWWWLASLLVLGFLLNRGIAAENDERSAAPHWLSDWEEGRKAARASGKPLFVVFRCEH